MQLDNVAAYGGADSGMVVFLCTASGRVLSASPRAEELFPADGEQTLRERLESRLRLNTTPSLGSALIDGEETSLVGLMDNREITLGVTPLNDHQRMVVMIESLCPPTSLDSLTGLPDRSAMLERIREIQSDGEGGHRLMLIDIDRLKTVNDYLGYHVGDRVIRDLAVAMQAAVPDDVMASRWSGHEFMLLIPPRQAEHSSQIAERIRSAAASVRFNAGEKATQLGTVTVSIGHGALGPGETSRTQPRDQLSSLNAAVYEAKRTGRDRVVNADRLQQPSVYTTGGALDRAIHEGRIVAASQPIVDLKTGEVVADEALARMITPEGDVIPAGLFIEAASRLQMAHRIDFEIINQTITNCVASIDHRPMAHFVNISGDFLQHPELMEQVISNARAACECIGGSGQVEVKPLVLEMTEREVLEDTADAFSALKPLIDFGLRLALDDFGSGYSSYRYLLDMPFTFLKIEGALVQNMSESVRAQKIVQHIQAMAKDMGLITVAEFIGDTRTADMLREMGIDWGQGFHFGRPEIIRPLTNHNRAMVHDI
ncbi:bifunctional diguanylate cyclase/phosphodiesterase [Guyparkeria hydrothermalis]|uniref:bifunctional diguanylate cyclase/phosphodiesterase n=1 Tax=Guyparkeria hydrothermalis TaxID=923 RepID=UPI0020201E04|nr:bifunctional diguanylate cyclase/phosphodiesterase [Guyparkeria hydrothermalis]MCL7750326.1 bifunctional diguanylate cyclase/phosphodiesterase [Guyparkeria hydrothermalis]